MIIVPTFAKGDEGQQKIVLTIVISLVALVAKDMGERIN
jgi:hypothetical protein